MNPGCINYPKYDKAMTIRKSNVKLLMDEGDKEPNCLILCAAALLEYLERLEATSGEEDIRSCKAASDIFGAIFEVFGLRILNEAFNLLEERKFIRHVTKLDVNAVNAALVGKS